MRDKNHKDIAYNLETKEASHAIGASELAVYWVELVELLVEDREGTKHARMASELVVCSPVLVASFAGVFVLKKRIIPEGQTGQLVRELVEPDGVKRDAVGLGVHVHAGQPAHHEVAVGALCGQEGDQGLGRGQHEANVVEVRGRAVGVHGLCQGQGHQSEGGQEVQAGDYIRGQEGRVHSEYKTSTFLSSLDVAHTSVLAAQGSCEAVRNCGAVLDRRGKLLKQLEILRSSVACRTQLGTV